MVNVFQMVCCCLLAMKYTRYIMIYLHNLCKCFSGFPGLSGGLINEQNQSLPQCRTVSGEALLLKILRPWPGVVGPLEKLVQLMNLAVCSHGLLMAFRMVLACSWCVFKAFQSYHDPKCSNMMVDTYL